MALVLASCTLPYAGSDAVPSSLSKYADAAAFLLPGFESYAFYTLPSEDGPLQEGAETNDRPVRFARCGSDFEAPHGAGIGPYRGVEVFDWGPFGIGDETPAGEACTIAEVPAWHQRSAEDPKTGKAVETWVAHVDDRFAVSSHHRELLAQALRRSGKLDQLLLPFASMPALPAQAESVFYLLPRPTDHTYWGRPVPIERMRIALSPDGRWRMWHRQPLPEQFTSFGADPHAQAVTTSENGWQITTIAWQIDWRAQWLLFEMFSGIAIFI